MNKYDEVFNELYSLLKEEKEKRAGIEGNIGRQQDYAKEINKRIDDSEQNLDNLHHILYVMGHFKFLTKMSKIKAVLITFLATFIVGVGSTSIANVVQSGVSIDIANILFMLSSCFGVVLGGGYYCSTRGAGDYLKIYNENKNNLDDLKAELDKETEKFILLCSDRDGIKEYLQELQDELKLSNEEIKELETKIKFISDKKMYALTKLSGDPLIEERLNNIYNRDQELINTLKRKK